MKFRKVAIFTGEEFSVPQCIQRIDSYATHGWQLRYGGETKLFSDFTSDGSGAAESLRLATAELLERIRERPAPTGLQQEPNRSKTSRLPVGISGPVMRTAKNRSPYFYFTVSIPRFGQRATSASVYIGTRATFTPERYTEALNKAIEIRRRAEEQFSEAATRAKREAAQVLETQLGETTDSGATGAEPTASGGGGRGGARRGARKPTVSSPAAYEA